MNPNTPHTHTSPCFRLGICNSLKPDQCSDCPNTPDRAPQPTYPFAPGVIDGPHPRTYSAAPTLKELAWVLALVLAFSALGGLLAGLVAGWTA